MILDIAIAIVVVFAMVLGYRAGFVRTFLHMAGWILALVLAFVWSPWAKKILMEKTDFYDSIYNALLERIADTLNLDKVAAALPTLLQSAVKNLGLEATNTAAASLANLFFTILGFLLVVFAIKLVFWLLTLLLSKRHNDGAVGFVDGFLGLIMGFIKGMILVFILLAVMVPAAGLMDPRLTGYLLDWLESSYVAGTLYDNNLIMLIVRDFLA